MTPRPGRPQTPHADDSSRPRLMIVDNGAMLDDPLTRALDKNGFRIELARDPDRVLDDTRGQRYDAILLNSDFAELDALRLCLALRVQGCLSPIVVAGNASTAVAELDALRVGATDWLERAMPHDLLVDRILARITGTRIEVTGLLYPYPITVELPTSAGILALSLVPTLVTINSRRISLTPIEERLFARLLAGQGAVVSPDELKWSAWFSASVSMRTVKSHVYQLRRKLQRFGLQVEHLRERGYRLPLPMPAELKKSAKASPAKS